MRASFINIHVRKQKMRRFVPIYDIEGLILQPSGPGIGEGEPLNRGSLPNRKFLHQQLIINIGTSVDTVSDNIASQTKKQPSPIISCHYSALKEEEHAMPFVLMEKPNFFC